MMLSSILLTLLLDWSGYFTRLELTSFDHRARLFRVDKAIHDDVVVVLIDEQSLQQMQRRFGRWPWPRSAYSDILEFFTLAKAQTVAFDILFSEQQLADQTAALGKSDDTVLVEATRKAGNVVHAMQLTQIAGDSAQSNLSVDFIQQHQIKQVRYTGKTYPNFLIPFKQLYKASFAVGNLEIEPDSDGIYRRIRLFNQYRDAVFPALSSALILPLFGADGEIDVAENQVNIAGFKIPLIDQGKYLINPVGRINTVSATTIFKTMDQLHAGIKSDMLLNPQDFENKIILIGASAIGLLDVKATALSATEPGVFLHASAVSNILEQDFLTTSTTLQDLTLLVVAAFFGVLPIMLMGNIVVAALLPLLLTAMYVVIAYSAFSYNQILPVINVVFIVAASMFMALYFRLATEKKHKQKVRTMLSQYVSPDVLSSVIDRYDVLDASVGKKENLTIMFSDIRDFTNISEQYEAAEIVDLLNIYFSEMTDIIFAQRGTLNKFIGDAILAFWGAPVKTTVHADQALAAALLMREKLPAVNQTLTDKGYTAIDVGIGIHTGAVILGNIGSHKKLDYTIIGDAVNLASRLEGLTKVYGVSILITEDTFNALQQPLPCIKVDKVTVKGKLQPVLLYTPAQNFITENKLSISVDQLITINQNSFDFYQQQQWKMAKRELILLSKTKLFQVIIERCDFYANQEPALDWNGIYEHTNK